jgi:hypothetical protein
VNRIQLQCRIDSADTAVLFGPDGDGDVMVHVNTNDTVVLDRAAQERLYAWLGEALGISASRQGERDGA